MTFWKWSLPLRQRIIKFSIWLYDYVTLQSLLFLWCCRLTRDVSSGALFNTDDIYDSIRQTTDDINNLIKDDTRTEKKDCALLNTNPLSTASSLSIAFKTKSESRVPTFFHSSSGKSRVKDEFTGRGHRLCYNQGSLEYVCIPTVIYSFEAVLCSIAFIQHRNLI